MTRQGGSSARFRQRKLSTKQNLHILREDQVDKVEDDQPRNIPVVDTGVEKAEEIEHHLQAAISASQAAAVGGRVAQIYIPTPETIESSIQYDHLYPARFSQPATYIRFSSTVEECIGVQYCMTSDDEAYLQSANQKRPTSKGCSVDEFEELMDFFEQISKSRQPFATVDNAPVISFQEMSQSPEFHETVSESARILAAEVYEHWKDKRMQRGHKPLMPSPKVSEHLLWNHETRSKGGTADGEQVETGQETDDGDAYVCFRRREVRQARKTRGRDAQSIEKLKKLRRELEDARSIVSLVQQRELIKGELLAAERAIFDHRMEIRLTKRRLNIKTDDDDLLNQKPPKSRVLEQATAQRPSVSLLRLSTRPDGRSTEADLVSLQDILRDKENEIQKDIEDKLVGHRAWLDQCPDFTTSPLTPSTTDSRPMTFRKVIAEVSTSPTPSATFEKWKEMLGAGAGSPAHAIEVDADADADADANADANGDVDADAPVTIEYLSTPAETDHESISYRRRFGRGGRLMIDRRGFRLKSTEGIDPVILDRFRYDRDDDDDDDDVDQVTVDPFDQWSMQYRASIMGSGESSQPRSTPVNTPRPPPG